MTQNKAASWAYSENAVAEPELIALARAQAAELGIDALSPATGHFLQSIAALPSVKAVAEVGTGTGVSSLYLLQAGADITLTSIDTVAEAQNYARENFARAGFRPSRFRLINGKSADLLPRLANNSYDLVIIDGDPLEAQGDVAESERMLRSGGILLVMHALYEDRVADPARRDEQTVTLRNLGRDLLDSPYFNTSLLPLGDGILFAVKL